jgi:hypothetical protein
VVALQAVDRCPDYRSERFHSAGEGTDSPRSAISRSSRNLSRVVHLGDDYLPDGLVSGAAACGQTERAGNRGLLAGGAAIVLLAILLLDFPYRMLSRNNEFETVNWNGARCYILGERQDDVLLFCPRLDPPRNRIISRRTEKLERLGVKESVFSPLSANQ